MKVRRFTLTLSLATIVLVAIFAMIDTSTASPEKDLNITNMVKLMEIVVVGTVKKAEFVYRGNIKPNYTTDITIGVEQMIKGEPNEGEDVKFMIWGGRGVNPNTGEDMSLEPEHSPKFTLNERVLLFLKRVPREHPPGFDFLPPVPQFPYDGLQVYYGEYGKRAVNLNKVAMPYTFTEDVVDNYDGVKIAKSVKRDRTADLPLDLVVKVAKASMIDPDEIASIEAEIATAISQAVKGSPSNVSQALLQKLEEAADGILDDDNDK